MLLTKETKSIKQIGKENETIVKLLYQASIRFNVRFVAGGIDK